MTRARRLVRNSLLKNPLDGVLEILALILKKKRKFSKTFQSAVKCSCVYLLLLQLLI